MKSAYVIGSGPNGLTAAIILARAGVRTTVLEAQPTVGGGTRSAELTLPGFLHDRCSAVHPLGIGSPVFASFPLAEHGLQWIQPDAPLAHPLDDRVIMLERSIDQTASRLGKDASRYRHWVEPLVADWPLLAREILAPLHFPSYPMLFARFGLLSVWSASGVAKTLFKTREARALFAGIAAHSILPLEAPTSAAIGWVLALAGHAVGWPIPRGGSQKIADALSSYFQSLGGTVVTNQNVQRLQELKDADAILCDLTPRQVLRIAGDVLPESYARQLEAYRYGPGVFKLDWALSGPIPWKDHACARAATVHLGGTLEEIADSERMASAGRISPRPFVLLAQPSLFDSSRAPAGQHTAWAYCHVPNGATVDRTSAIESQVERFAPGFRQRILARHVMKPADLEAQNANLIGGDIAAGTQDWRQLFFRPTRRLYRTPVKGLYFCSASTPPGAGVHGMCGFHAAQAALEDDR